MPGNPLLSYDPIPYTATFQNPDAAFPASNVGIYEDPRAVARSSAGTGSNRLTLDLGAAGFGVQTIYLLDTNATGVTVKTSNDGTFVSGVTTVVSGASIPTNLLLDRARVVLNFAGTGNRYIAIETTAVGETIIGTVALFDNSTELAEALYPQRVSRRRATGRYARGGTLHDLVAHLGNSFVRIPVSGPWYKGGTGDPMILHVHAMLRRRLVPWMGFYVNGVDASQCYLVRRVAGDVERLETPAEFNVSFVLEEPGG